MKTRPFNLQDALNGAKLVTRFGEKVEEFRKCHPGEQTQSEMKDHPYRARIDGDLIEFTELGTRNVNWFDLLIVEGEDDDEAQTPFDLDKAIDGHPLVTRDGRTAKNFLMREEDDELYGSTRCFPFMAEVGDELVTYTIRGRYTGYVNDSEYDLFLANE